MSAHGAAEPHGVTSVWADVRGTLRPGPDSPDGLLPPLLVLLTLVTGLVDATSYLRLGHVFVANMTGNVVFVGFVLAGAKGVSLAASFAAIAGFVVGGVAAGRLAGALAPSRPALLGVATSVQALAVVAATIVAAADGHPAGAARYALSAVLALSMGVQTAAVRRLAVPELTTTVLTMTLTGLAADSRLAGGPGSRIGRRGIALAAMLAGAAAGGALVLNVGLWAPLATATAVLVAVAAGATRAHRVERPAP